MDCSQPFTKSLQIYTFERTLFFLHIARWSMRLQYQSRCLSCVQRLFFNAIKFTIFSILLSPRTQCFQPFCVWLVSWRERRKKSFPPFVRFFSDLYNGLCPRFFLCRFSFRWSFFHFAQSCPCLHLKHLPLYHQTLVPFILYPFSVFCVSNFLSRSFFSLYFLLSLCKFFAWIRCAILQNWNFCVTHVRWQQNKKSLPEKSVQKNFTVHESQHDTIPPLKLHEYVPRTMNETVSSAVMRTDGTPPLLIFVVVDSIHMTVWR